MNKGKTNDAGEATDLSVEETLAERGNRYGSFKDHSEISQYLLEALVSHASLHNKKLEPYMKESLTLICHKLGRIVNGDPYYDDSWRDIAGYATLVVDILNGKDT